MSFPGWDSPPSVSEIHQALEGAAILFFAALVLFDVVAHFEPPRHKLYERLGLVCFAIAVTMELIAFPYGKRNDEFSAKEIARLNRDAESYKAEAARLQMTVEAERLARVQL